MPSTEASAKDMLEHAWRYFALHAGQRISLFNFFLIVSVSVAAGLAACLQRSGLFLVLGAGLGCALVVISFVFWKLDQRTSFLVKHGEDAIVTLETLLPTDAARIFSRESALTAAQKGGFVLLKMWTYGAVFRTVFCVMGIVGAIGAALCLVLYRGWVR